MHSENNSLYCGFQLVAKNRLGIETGTVSITAACDLSTTILSVVIGRRQPFLYPARCSMLDADSRSRESNCMSALRDQATKTPKGQAGGLERRG